MQIMRQRKLYRSSTYDKLFQVGLLVMEYDTIANPRPGLQPAWVLYQTNFLVLPRQLPWENFVVTWPQETIMIGTGHENFLSACLVLPLICSIFLSSRPAFA